MRQPSANNENKSTEARSARLAAQERQEFHALGFFLADLDKEVAYWTGATLRGVNLQKQGDGFLVVVKVRLDGQALVAFLGGRTLLECYRRLYIGLTKDGLTWARDKYAK
jgi:hypothetical protein